MSSPKSQTVTNKSEPWKEAKPYYIDLYEKASDALKATNKQVYGGDLWTGPNATQKEAVNKLKGNQWDTGADETRQLGLDTVSGKYLTAESNPYLKGAVDTALSDVSNKYTREVLPGLGSAAIQGGAYGGGRQGVVNSLAAGEFSREANEAATNIYATNYENERNRQMQAPSLFGQANSLEQDMIKGLAGAGQQEQDWANQQNMEDYQKWQMAQAAPWAGIPEMLSVLSGGGFQSTASTGPNPSYMSPMQMAMGGGSLLTGLMDAFKPA
jgi:hypothetical protein